MICSSFRTVVYPRSFFSRSASWTSRTVEGPRSHSTRRISSSDAVGFCGCSFDMLGSVIRRFSYCQRKSSYLLATPIGAFQVPWNGRGLSSDGLPWFQDEWQAILRIADNHHFGVRAGCQFLGGFDPFPFEQLRANACRHDLLEVRNALGLDAFPLRFLLLLLQDETHSERVLLRLLLGLD